MNTPMNTAMTTLFDLPSDALNEILSQLQDVDYAVLKHTCARFRELVAPHAVDAFAVGKQAVAYGSIPLIEWTRSAGYPRDADVCGTAAATGNLELLQWALSMGYPRILSGLWELAEKHGHTHIMDWLLSVELCGMPTSSPVNASPLQTLKWFHARGIAITLHSWFTKMDLDTMQWLHANGISLANLHFPDYLSWISAETAAWLLDIGYLIGSPTEMTYAAKGLNWPVVDLYIDQGVSVQSYLIAAALKAGDLKRAECYASQCEVLEDMFVVSAALSGRIEVVDWTISRYPKELDLISEWSSDALRAAINADSLVVFDKLLELAKTIDFPYDKYALYYCAASHASTTWLDVLVARGIAPPARLHCDSVVKNLKSIVVLDWLHAARVSLDSSVSIYSNNFPGGRELITWFHLHGHNAAKHLVQNAAYFGDIRTVKWAYAGGIADYGVKPLMNSLEAAKWAHSIRKPMKVRHLRHFLITCDIEALEWIYDTHRQLFDELLAEPESILAPNAPRSGTRQYADVSKWLAAKGLRVDDICKRIVPKITAFDRDDALIN